MLVKWLHNKKRTDSALVGKVLDQSERYYTVLVISWSHRAFSHLEGQTMLVRRDIAQIDNSGYEQKIACHNEHVNK